MYNNEIKEKFTNFIKNLYSEYDFIPLHAPVFLGKEKEYLNNCIETTFVSYVGKFVSDFEEAIKKYTGAKNAIAVVNGTVALQIALSAVGVKPDSEVITQALTFVATTNAISHNYAKPIFLDVDKNNLGLSPENLLKWLKENASYDINLKKTINKKSKKIISVVVPVHIFGHPCYIDDIIEIANQFEIAVVEDAAEAIGSFYKNKHAGTFAKIGILSFNGNKTVTTGGGGMILTDDDDLAKYIRHITTTAKVNHPYEFVHDQIAYNFRMPNINAAVGFAQMEYIDFILKNKRETFELYKKFCYENDINIINEPENSKSNFWLNALILDNIVQRNDFLEFSNSQKIQTRAIWRLMNMLDMYKDCQSDNLQNSVYFYERVVNIPSGVRNAKN